MNTKEFKKYIYIGLFTGLGVLVNFLVHGALELFIIDLLQSDFERYSMGISWAGWFAFHAAATPVLFVGFTWLGFSQGRKWWKIIYETEPLGKKTKGK